MVEPEGTHGMRGSGRITRREVLKRGVLGAAGLAGLTVLPAVIAACGKSATPSPAATPPPPTPATPPPQTPTPTPADFLARNLAGGLTVGNALYTNPAQIKGLAAVDAAFESVTGLALTVDLIGPGTYADPFSPFLLAQSDAFFWFPGFRTRSLAAANLAPMQDVWALASANVPAGMAQAVTGDDGKVFGIPINFYPWGVFYRKSLWAAKGYEVPTTWTEFLALCARMKKDKLTPMAFADRDGWPAMGTFDILNLRLNGYDFHMGLMTGKEKWTDSRVAAVFETWRQLIPFYSSGSTDLFWQQACDSLTRKTAGMYYSGMFMKGQVAFVDRAAVDDLDFFPFPYFGNEFDSEGAIEAPADIVTVLANSPTLGADLVNASAYLEFWAKGSVQMLMYRADDGLIPTALDADVSQLDPMSGKAVSLVRRAGRITQFMDRDARPDFTGAAGMQSFLLAFLRKPDRDLAALGQEIQTFWDGLPPYTE